MQRSCNSCGMMMDGPCSHPRCPGRKSTAVVPHFDTAPSDEFETLRKRVEALEKVLDREKNDYRNLRSRLTGKLGAATKRAEKAEAALTEARALSPSDKPATPNVAEDVWLRNEIAKIIAEDWADFVGVGPAELKTADRILSALAAREGE